MNDLPGRSDLPPGTLPQDVSDRERREDDAYWLEFGMNAEPEDKE